MTFRAVILLVFFAGLFAFIGLNWSEFSATSTLSLGFAVVQIPVGFVMLGALLLIVVLFSAYVLYLQASWALQQRRAFNELEAQRKLADQAEASRTAELMARVNTVFDLLTESMTASATVLEQRIAQTLKANDTSLQEISHSLSAHLGEIEDKLDKALDTTMRGGK